jgi:hypothetical protein
MRMGVGSDDLVAELLSRAPNRSLSVCIVAQGCKAVTDDGTRYGHILNRNAAVHADAVGCG